MQDKPQANTRRPDPAPSGPRFRRRLGGMLLLVLLGLTGLLWFGQRSMVFPGAYRAAGPSVLPVGGERWLVNPDDASVEVSEPSDGTPMPEFDGRVEAWFLPGRGTSAARPGPAVMFFHGNGELIDDWADTLAWYPAAGVSLLLVEYRGYGRSTGSAHAAGIVADAQALRETLDRHPAVDARRVIYHGRSLGSGIVGELTATHPPAAMVIASGLTSLHHAAQSVLPVPRWMMRDRMDLEPQLQAFPGPVLILHGQNDRVLPPDHARRLDRAAVDSELVWYDHGHNDLPGGAGRASDVLDFLHRRGLTPNNRQPAESVLR